MTVIKRFCICCNLRSGSMFVAVYSLLSSAFYVALLLIRNVGYRFVETSAFHAVVTYGTFAVFGLLAIMAVGLIVGVYQDNKWLFGTWLLQTLLAHIFATVTVVWLVVTNLRAEEMMTVESLSNVTDHGAPAASRQELPRWEIGILCYHAANLIITAYCVMCVVSQLQELLGGRGTQRHRRRQRRRRQVALFFSETSGDANGPTSSSGGNGSAQIVTPPPYCEKPPPYSTFPRGVDPPRDYEEDAGGGGGGGPPVVPNAARPAVGGDTFPSASDAAAAAAVAAVRTSSSSQNDREPETGMSSAHARNDVSGGTETQDVTLVVGTTSGVASYATMPHPGFTNTSAEMPAEVVGHRTTGRPNRSLQPASRSNDFSPTYVQLMRRIPEAGPAARSQLGGRQGDPITHEKRVAGDPPTRHGRARELSPTRDRSRDANPSRDPDYVRHRDVSPSHNPAYARHRDVSPSHNPAYVKHRDVSPTHNPAYVRHRDLSPSHNPAYVRHRDVSPSRENRRRELSPTRHPLVTKSQDLPSRPAREPSPERPRGRPRDRSPERRRDLSPGHRSELSALRNKNRKAEEIQHVQGPGGLPRSRDDSDLRYSDALQSGHGRRKPAAGDQSAVYARNGDRRRMVDLRGPVLRSDTRPRDTRPLRDGRVRSADVQPYSNGPKGPYVY